jgi:arylsulfatase A
VLDDGYSDEAVEKLGAHKPAGMYRGGKYSAFEAGTRVPAIVYWPGKVKPGVSDAVVSQVDWLASLAALAGQQSTAPDSRNMLPVLLGESTKGRDELLEESYTFSLRQGQWKYIAPKEKGEPDWFKNKKIESGLSKETQLYDLKTDPQEKTNVAAQHPEIIQQLQTSLERIRAGK